MKVLTGDAKKWHKACMEEKKDTTTLVNRLEALEASHGNKRTAFLDEPKVKKTLVKKLGEGVTMKSILNTLAESGFKISMASLRKWMKENKVIAQSSKKLTLG